MSAEWVVYVPYMIASTTAMYLVVRRLNALKVSRSAILFVAMASTALVSSLLVVIEGVQFEIPHFSENVFVLGTAIICCYVGNVMEVRGIASAPNAGLCLAITKGYSLLTLPIAWYFFGGAIGWNGVVGVATIVFFQALIILSQKRIKKQVVSGERSGLDWLKYSFISLIGLAGMTIAWKYLSVDGMNRLVFLTILTLAAAVIFGAELLESGVRLPLTKEVYMLFAVLGLASAASNYFLYSAIAAAPNFAFATAANAGAIGFVTILSIPLFKDKLGFVELIGVVGTMSGLLLIVFQ